MLKNRCPTTLSRVNWWASYSIRSPSYVSRVIHSLLVSFGSGCTWQDQEVICGARALSGSVSLIWLSPTTYYCIKDAKELFPSHRWVILYDCSLCWWVGATPTDWLTTADDGALVGSFSVRKVTEINANTFFVNSRMVNKWMGAFCWSIVEAFVGPQQQSCSLKEVCEKKGELWGWSNVCR